MQAKKRNSIIIGTVLIIGAATFAYFYSREKRGGDASGESLPSSTPPSTSEKTKTVTQEALKQNAPIKQVSYTKANDVLAGSVNAANNKLAYATGDTGIYNMQSEKSFTAKKGDVLGAVVSARKTTGGYIIYFIAKNGVKYWTYSGNVQIKTA
jgi:hypothetical protein